ncbi:MAG: 16S rRNA (guanine(527)-N(7))-methyltransferase RsmG [Lachnospiraceae bacterium]|nr:16S rRNA (guanine(527)-N(7))-methyltransferase RsmG [Lachnospiraceae bacterium]
MKNLLKEICEKIEINITEEQCGQFELFYQFLLEKNKVMNLTAITEKNDVVMKHFIDSIYILRNISLSGKKIIDVGTGAGFPGIPLSIMVPDAQFVLLDSLNKRVRFLDEASEICKITSVEAIHSRAEDAARDENYREKFDFVLSRAVANMSTLLEYCSPFVKVGGQFISYKSGQVDEELKAARHAEKMLNCKYMKSIDFVLPDTDMERKLVIYEKNGILSEKYPRQAGKPKKEPL